MSQACSAVLKTALLLWAAGALAGCGDGTEVSWCLSSNNGGSTVSAGYNSSDCPPRPEPAASAP